jgi:hypothetical protein
MDRVSGRPFSTGPDCCDGQLCPPPNQPLPTRTPTFRAIASKEYPTTGKQTVTWYGLEAASKSDMMSFMAGHEKLVLEGVSVKRSIYDTPS